MRLPTFTLAGMELFKRLTLIADDGRIEKIFYPVFPPDLNADEVLSWLQQNARSCASAGAGLRGFIRQPRRA